MKSLVCQAQHIELNPLLYRQPMKLSKTGVICSYHLELVIILVALKLALCNTIQNGVSFI